MLIDINCRGIAWLTAAVSFPRMVADAKSMEDPHVIVEYNIIGQVGRYIKYDIMQHAIHM